MAYFSIKNLNYKNFENFNFEINQGDFVSIIAPNHSGKTMLTKIILGIYPTSDICILDKTKLNEKEVLNYIKKIGVATNEFNQEFLFKKVKDELAYPLLNLGYPEHKINKQITKISKYFKIEKILNKDINTLNSSTKKKLLIILALIHDPKLLILDSILDELNKNDLEFMLNKLEGLNKQKLTIINFTNNLETISKSNTLYTLDNFKLDNIKELDYNTLKEKGIIIPFPVELSMKLKYFKKLDKIYFNLDELKGALWK